MIATRFAPVVLAAAVLAGCQNTPENYIEPVQPTAPVESDDASMAELINRNLKTTEINVSRLKDPAKTVGYAAGSTEVGEKLLDGALVVEHVTRQDADNHFGVTVTVFNNRDDGSASFEWRIAFFNPQGVELSSLQREWKGKALGAKSWGTVSNSATVSGATTFKLEARPPQAAPPPAP